MVLGRRCAVLLFSVICLMWIRIGFGRNWSPTLWRPWKNFEPSFPYRSSPGTPEIFLWAFATLSTRFVCSWCFGFSIGKGWGWWLPAQMASCPWVDRTVLLAQTGNVIAPIHSGNTLAIAPRPWLCCWESNLFSFTYFQIFTLVNIGISSVNTT